MGIAFIDLKTQQEKIQPALNEAMARVLAHGQYILGPEVRELEAQLAEFCGVDHCLACASGTDALALPLMAWGIRPGDAVFVPAFTFVATAEVVAWLGAKPFFVDVNEDDFNLNMDSLKAAYNQAKAQGLTPKAVIPVDLFGQPADYPAIEAFAADTGMMVLEDGAQSFGAELHGKKVGAFGQAAGTSFFPAKPLGCYGDGGAVFSNDAELVDKMRSIAIHGQGSNKYENVRIGINSRLDTLQAAVLQEKLKIFPDELIARQKVADRYNAGLEAHCTVPRLNEGATSAWAQYTLVLEGEDQRAHVQAACKEAGVPCVVYYPIPLSEQKGYLEYPRTECGTPASQSLSRRVLSLPMHPYLDEATQDRIIEVVAGALK